MIEYRTLPEWLAFLRAIRENPEDDLVRLAAADWLEEYGEAEYAEFIRVQIEILRLRLQGTPGVYHADEPDAADKLDTLRRREWALWIHLPSTSGLLPRLMDDLCECAVLLGGQDYGRGLGTDFPWLIVRRGFVAEVRVPTLAAWLGGECNKCEGDGVSLVADYHRWKSCKACRGTGRVEGIGRAVCAAHPVERVAVGDREPAALRGGVFAWAAKPSTFADAAELPADLVRRSPHLAGDHPTREAALAALSDTLIALARA